MCAACSGICVAGRGGAPWQRAGGRGGNPGAGQAQVPMPEELKLGKNGNSGPGQRNPRCTSSANTHRDSGEPRHASGDAHHEGRALPELAGRGRASPLRFLPPQSFPKDLPGGPSPRNREASYGGGATGTPRSYGIGCVQAGVTASPPRPAGFPQDSKPDGGSNPGLNATCGPGSAPQLTIPGPQTRKWPPIAPCLP